MLKNNLSIIRHLFNFPKKRKLNLHPVNGSLQRGSTRWGDEMIRKHERVSLGPWNRHFSIIPWATSRFLATSTFNVNTSVRLYHSGEMRTLNQNISRGCGPVIEPVRPGRLPPANINLYIVKEPTALSNTYRPPPSILYVRLKVLHSITVYHALKMTKTRRRQILNNCCRGFKLRVRKPSRRRHQSPKNTSRKIYGKATNNA